MAHKGEQFVTSANVCVTRDQIVEEARSWLGVPWRHQGRNRTGIDCGGLVAVVGQATGVFPKRADAFGYDRLPTLYLLVETTQEWMRRKMGPEFNDRRPGDVVIMKPTAQYQWPSHIGILTRLPDGELGLIHSYNGLRKKGADVVLETRYAPWWDRTVAVMVYPGLVEDD